MFKFIFLKLENKLLKHIKTETNKYIKTRLKHVHTNTNKNLSFYFLDKLSFETIQSKVFLENNYSCLFQSDKLIEPDFSHSLCEGQIFSSQIILQTPFSSKI